jgi:lipid A 4'-phosphatase
MGIEDGPAQPPFMMSNRGVGLALALVVLVVALFALNPGFDLAAAGYFYAGEGRFVGVTPLGVHLRQLFSLLPFFILGGAAVLYGLRRLGTSVPAPTGRALAMLALSLALGPGLLVNDLLKDHWHRPRPVQVTQFGGTETFRPLGLPGGDCNRNCSFVSGEGSSSFWSVAPALLVPLPWRAAALGAALVYAAATGLLRMAFGGHFLSDTLLAALFTWLVIAAVWRALIGNRSPASRP